MHIQTTIWIFRSECINVTHKKNDRPIVLTNHMFSIISEHGIEVKTTSTSSFVIFDRCIYTCLGSQLLCVWSDDIWNLSPNTQKWIHVFHNFFFPVSHSCLHLLLIQAPDKHGLTPLISACYENHIACVKLLLEKVGTLIWTRTTNASACTQICPDALHPSTHADVSEASCESRVLMR